MEGRLQKKRNNLDDEYTIVTVDQTRQVLSKLINAWFPSGERPTLPVKGKWESGILSPALPFVDADADDAVDIEAARIDNTEAQHRGD